MNKNLTKIQRVFALAIVACCLTACPKASPKYDPLESGPAHKDLFLEKVTIDYVDSNKDSETYIADSKYYLSEKEGHYDYSSHFLFCFENEFIMPFVDFNEVFQYEYNKKSHVVTLTSKFMDSDSSRGKCYMSGPDSKTFMMDLHVEYIKDQGENARTVTYTYSDSRTFDEYALNFKTHNFHACSVYDWCNYFELKSVKNVTSGLDEDINTSQVQHTYLKNEDDGFYFALRDSNYQDLYKTKVEAYFEYGPDVDINNSLRLVPVDSSDCQIDFGEGWIIRKEKMFTEYYSINFTYNGYIYTFNSPLFDR